MLKYKENRTSSHDQGWFSRISDNVCGGRESRDDVDATKLDVDLERQVLIVLTIGRSLRPVTEALVAFSFLNPIETVKFK